MSKKNVVSKADSGITNIQQGFLDRLNYSGFQPKQAFLKIVMGYYPNVKDHPGEIEDMIDKGLLVELFYQLPGKTRPSSLLFPGGTEMRTWKQGRDIQPIQEVSRE